MQYNILDRSFRIAHLGSLNRLWGAAHHFHLLLHLEGRIPWLLHFCHSLVSRENGGWRDTGRGGRARGWKYWGLPWEYRDNIIIRKIKKKIAVNDWNNEECRLIHKERILRYCSCISDYTRHRINTCLSLGTLSTECAVRKRLDVAEYHPRLFNTEMSLTFSVTFSTATPAAAAAAPQVQPPADRQSAGCWRDCTPPPDRVEEDIGTAMRKMQSKILRGSQRNNTERTMQTRHVT